MKTERIEALRREAAEVGDLETEKLCRAALSGGTRALGQLEELFPERCPVCGDALPEAHRDRRVTHSGRTVCSRASCEAAE